MNSASHEMNLKTIPVNIINSFIKKELHKLCVSLVVTRMKPSNYNSSYFLELLNHI